MKFLVTLIFCLTFLSSQGSAKGVPPAFNMMSSIDWVYFADVMAISIKMCSCTPPGAAKGVPPEYGWEVTIVEPIMISDVTNQSWNLASVGIKFDTSITSTKGSSQDGGDESGGFRFTHTLLWPVMSVLNIIHEELCFEKFDKVDVSILSEINPSSKIDMFSWYEKPLLLVVANPIAQAICAFDCAAGGALNDVWFCNGCLKPVNSFSNYIDGQNVVAESQAVIRTSITQSALHMAQMKTTNAPFTRRTGSGGVLKNSLCKPTIYLDLIKTQYATNLAFPVIDDAVPFGTHPMLFSDFKNKLDTEDDVVFWIWRKKQFCMGAYDCKATFSVD